MPRPGSIIWFLCLLLASPVLAQPAPKVALSGTVTSAATGETLPGAHVFIGASMIGTVTDGEGRFALEGVPFGSHTLWVSILGFETTSKALFVSDTSATVHDIAVKPTVIEVGEVTVVAKQDRRWRKRLATFERLFIGETPFAAETAIVNPEVLDFDATWLGTFRAEAGAPLHIDNRALGYTVRYYLKEFERVGGTIRYDGDPLFEEMTPANEDEARLWEENRRSAFNGSLRHFLLALWRGTAEDEGFQLYRIPSIEDINRNDRRFGVDADRLLVPGGSPTERILTFTGLIEITYLNELEDQAYLSWHSGSPHRRLRPQRSWIRLTDGPTEIDINGEIVDPYGVTVYGYYAYERMANDVPKEYRPDGF